MNDNLFNFEIGKVADTLVSMSGMIGKDYETTWKYYIHDLIKEQFTLNEVLDYIKKKEKQGEQYEPLA